MYINFLVPNCELQSGVGRLLLKPCRMYISFYSFYELFIGISPRYRNWACCRDCVAQLGRMDWLAGLSANGTFDPLENFILSRNSSY